MWIGLEHKVTLEELNCLWGLSESNPKESASTVAASMWSNPFLLMAVQSELPMMHRSYCCESCISLSSSQGL